MSQENIEGATERGPLRIWPGVALLALLLIGRFVVPMIDPDLLPFAVMGSMVGGLLIAIWWLFFSRASWKERLGVLGLMVVAMLITSQLVDKSIATSMMGMMLMIYSIPLFSAVLVGWAALTREWSDRTRYLTLLGAVVAICAFWTTIRTGGFTGDLEHDFGWRWAETAEDRLVAAEGTNVVSSTATLTDSVVAWPGFRGPERNSVIRGVQIATDWTASPPSELWRRPIGPGWSSFAVQGNLIYTQEQRGEDEVVACYDITSGEPVWRHSDNVRFWESNAGAGPRGTPTLHDGRVYSLGATGILNVLDATSGSVIWSRDAAKDTGEELPVWGFSGSPLIVDSLVLVTASSALIAYNLADGEQRWVGPAGGEGYCSPYLTTIDGVRQVLHLSGKGLTGVSLSDGKTLWEHEWGGFPIVQPGRTANGDLLISVDASSGLRRLTVAQGTEGWSVKEHWTTNRLKPYYSGFVVHDGRAYGFDGNFIACVDLEDGKRKWKGGRYGAGQLALLPDQDLLLILTEKGDLALVATGGEKFNELARIPAIKGKTWNHPVLVDDVLLVRNGKEMAAFRLSLTGS